MRLLIVTDSLFAQSAYSIQTKLLAQRLIAAGHEVIVYGSTYYGQRIEIDGVPMVGNSSELTYDVQVINAHARRYDVDAVFTFKDSHVYSPLQLRQLERPWIALAPIDTEPLSTACLQTLNYASAVIAITRYGQQALASQGIQAHYAPHGYDPDIFKPSDKAAARKALNIPADKFMALVVGLNTSNPSRKNLDQIFLAWDAFKTQFDDVLLYAHTNMSIEGGGVNLELMVKQLGWDGRHFRRTNPYDYESQQIEAGDVAMLYQAADVLLMVGNEGFGVPAIEAQACGTPVIAIDFAGLRDTVQRGWIIPTAPKFRPAHGELAWCELGAFRFRVSQQAIYEALKAAREKRDDAVKRQEAIDHAKSYAIDTVVNTHWLPVMAQIESLLKEGQIEVTA